ncbi:MAG: hypothetical protein B7Z46_01930 [Hydrogenophilales bacterium 12-64-6]|nr:MAG: hypothetical protein B7Z46_01930 [Hydrogenophilales bacterium 12-64-6]
MSSNSVTVTYRRGRSYVQNRYQAKGPDKQPLVKDGRPVMQTAHGLVGELWVHGLMFETIERMDGYMHMKGGQTYRNSTIYWNGHYGSYVINPWLGRKAEEKQGNILMHPANHASHLEGCVSVGFLNPQGRLEDSKYSFDVLWDQCGGAAGARQGQVVLNLVVEGDMPARSACTAWCYTG